MPPIRLRIARTSDETAISALLAASYGELLAGDYSPAELAAALPLMTRANSALLASGTYYVAETPSAGGPIGCGGWTFERPGSGALEHGIAHIRHFATHLDWTRRGVAGLLLKRCIEDAEARGAHALECYSTLTAEPFYASLGFSRCAPIDVPLTATTSLPSVHMIRRSP